MFIICLLALSRMVGQTQPEVHFTVDPDPIASHEVAYRYLLGHKVFLRKTPSKKGKKLTLLNIGTPLVLTQKSKSYEEIDGIRSHWYHVIAGEYKGWVWGGLIGQETFGSQANYDVKFVYGLERFKTSDSLVEEKYQIRAFRNGMQLDKIVFDGHQSNPLEIKNIGNKGLFNVEDIITLQVADAKRGSNQGRMYIFWNNGKFSYVANLIGKVEPNYTKKESFIFPSDMEGKKSTIILKTRIMDKTRSLEDKTLKEASEVTTTMYTWNGYKLTKKEGIPIVSSPVVAQAKKP